MSDLDPSERDELISAYLDGEATPTERDLIANEPELLARAEHLAQIVSMITTPVTQPDHPTRETHITTALQASSTSPTITSINPAPNRRPDIMRIASIAAIVMAITLAVPLLLLLNNDNQDDDTAAIENATADEEVTAAQGTAGAVAADELPESATASGGGSEETVEAAIAEADSQVNTEATGDGGDRASETVIELGPVLDLDELISRLAESDGAVPEAATEAEIPTVSCRDELVDSVGRTDGELTLGTAILAGQDVVFVTDNAEPAALVVLDAETCAEIGRR